MLHYDGITTERLVLEDHARQEAQALAVFDADLADRTKTDAWVFGPMGVAEQRFDSAISVADGVIRMTMTATPEFVDPQSALVTEPETRHGRRWYDDTRRGPFPRQVADQLALRRGDPTPAIAVEVSIGPDGKPTLEDVDPNVLVVPKKRITIGLDDNQEPVDDASHWHETADRFLEWRIEQGALTLTDDDGNRLTADGEIVAYNHIAADRATKVELEHAVGIAVAEYMHQTDTPAAYLTQGEPDVDFRHNQQLTERLRRRLDLVTVLSLGIQAAELTTDSSQIHNGYAARFVTLKALSSIEGYATLSNLVARYTGKELPFEADRMEALAQRQRRLQALDPVDTWTNMQRAKTKKVDMNDLRGINRRSQRLIGTPDWLESSELKHWAENGYLEPARAADLLSLELLDIPRTPDDRLQAGELAMRYLNSFPDLSQAVLDELGERGQIASTKRRITTMSGETGGSVLAVVSVGSPDGRKLRSVASDRRRVEASSIAHTQVLNQVVDGGYHR